MKVCVLYNLVDKVDNAKIAEADEDTYYSANEISNQLKLLGFETELLGIAYQDISKIGEIKADIVFNLIEWSGKHTKDGVYAIKTLEKMKIPFTGSDSMGYELSSNKLVMKKAMNGLGIPTPKWQVFENDLKGVANDFRYPVIVKPALEHCGIGIDQKSVVSNENEMRNRVSEMLREYDSPVLVEEYIDGRELQVTILERYGKPWVLPAAEVLYQSKNGFWPILTYDAKWKNSGPEFELSDMALANIEDGLRFRVEQIASQAYDGLGGRDYPRLDLRVKGIDVYVLEINNNPGIDFDLQSAIGVSARKVGFDYPRLLKHIVENAYLRFKK